MNGEDHHNKCIISHGMSYLTLRRWYQINLGDVMGLDCSEAKFESYQMRNGLRTIEDLFSKILNNYYER